LNVPFAALTDRDVQDGKSLGETRVARLLQVLDPKLKFKAEEVAKVAKDRGLFLNDYTLEVDLFKCGRHKSMMDTMLELSDNEASKKRATEWRAKPANIDPVQLLKDIGEIGKGRFAQRLATNMTGTPCPTYIKE